MSLLKRRTLISCYHRLPTPSALDKMNPCNKCMMHAQMYSEREWYVESQTYRSQENYQARDVRLMSLMRLFPDKFHDGDFVSVIMDKTTIYYNNYNKIFSMTSPGPQQREFSLALTQWNILEDNLWDKSWWNCVCIYCSSQIFRCTILTSNEMDFNTFWSSFHLVTLTASRIAKTMSRMTSHDNDTTKTLK